MTLSQICLCISGVVFAAAALAAEDLSVLPADPDGPAPKKMMHEFLMRNVHEALDRHDAEYEKLKTPKRIEAYQESMRRFFVEALGGFPERTPLNARVVAKEDRGGYRVEKVIFESRPRHYVTAMLYLPEAKAPYPGVLIPCGHSGNGKASQFYQQAGILLAKNGMAALCYDPIEQGERFQLLDASGKPVEGGTTAHCMVGVGSTLLGRNTATYRIWDGMRAIDYLQSREEVDPERIGCTGNSGGGTLTSYLMALDDRIKCAAPSCYLTSLRRLLDTIGPQDAEQNIAGQIAHGMGHVDYVMMRAPRPTLMCAATRDFFDIDGTWDTFRRAKRVYTRLGFPERVDIVETDAKHGFHQPLRVAMVRWMRRWLMGVDDAITETDSPIVSDEQARCTPRGQVMLLKGARNTYDINIEINEKLAAARKSAWSKADRSEALNEVRRVTGIRRAAELPEPKVKTVGAIKRNGYRIEKLIIEPEAGIRLPALAFVPDKTDGTACLYLHGEGKQADAGPDGPMHKLAAAGRIVLAVDLRGIGETSVGKPGGRGIPRYIGADWKEQYLAYMLGRPYLTMRAEDVLTCARFLSTYHAGGKPNSVHLAGIGRACPPALHAAALEPAMFASVSLTNCLVSWSNVVRTPMAAGHFENVVHGALKSYDLPDLLRSLPDGKVKWHAPLDALGRPATRE